MATQQLPAKSPVAYFHTFHYLRHTARRLEHLASLNIPVRGQTVLEVGAGIGDHSHYYLNRGCPVTITDSRPENLDVLRQRYPGADVRLLDLDAPKMEGSARFEVVHCYGLLYHLKNPALALAFMAEKCSGILFLETCVSFGIDRVINPTPEQQNNYTEASSGMGCRPTRPWVFAELKKHFAHVYVPRTQPNHEEFPVDWSARSNHEAKLSRAIFVASRRPISNGNLATELLDQLTRHA